MNHEQLRLKAVSVLRRNRAALRKDGWQSQVGFGCGVVLSEMVSAAGDIPDAIGWRWGKSVMIECKASRADFFADAKKPQRLAGSGVGDQRYFMTPKELIAADELPEGWGLLWVDGRNVEIVHEAPERELDGAGHASEKRLLLSALQRIKMREFLIVQREHVDEVLDGAIQ